LHSVGEIWSEEVLNIGKNLFRERKERPLSEIVGLLSSKLRKIPIEYDNSDHAGFG
jgi:hypothetical protein